MPTHAAAPLPEADYRKYRRFLTVLALTLVTAGTIWVLLSVAVTIYRRGQVDIGGIRIGTPASRDELRACLEEIYDGAQALDKHLESFHRLLGRYSSTDAQTWADEGSVWQRRWSELGHRCRMTQAAPAGVHATLAAIHGELAQIHARYTRELKRLGTLHAPRLIEVRAQLEDIATELARAPAPRLIPETTREKER